MMVFYAPKNFKKGRLIAMRFRPIDLLIFACGISFSVITLIGYLTLYNRYNLLVIIAILLPAGIVSILTMIPFNLYHNCLEYLKLWIRFKRSNRRFIWEGIYKYEE